MAGKKSKAPATKPRKQAIPKEIEFDYIKSNFFRVISASGAFGGLSPSGREINMAIFSERRAIPTKTVHTVAPDGVLGKEDMSRREGRKAFVREIELDLVIDLPTAVTMQAWLQEKIEQCAQAQGVSLDDITQEIKKATDARKAARDG